MKILRSKQYIVSVDVEYSNEPNIVKTLKTDGFQQKQQQRQKIQIFNHWKRALHNKQFRIDLLILSIVNDLLHLDDTLSQNSSNYGVVEYRYKQDQLPYKYKTCLIDHQYIGRYRFKPEKNPIISLILKLHGNSKMFRKYKGQLISYQTIRDNKLFTNPSQLKQQLRSAIQVVKVSFKQALQQAIKFVSMKYDKKWLPFQQNIKKTPSKYQVQIQVNLQNFIQMHLRYLQNLQQVAKKVEKVFIQDLKYKEQQKQSQYDAMIRRVKAKEQLMQEQNQSKMNQMSEMNKINEGNK